MKHSSTWLALLIGPSVAMAEEPLSAIDWLREPPPITVARPLIEPIGLPETLGGAVVPQIEVQPLDSAQPDAAGLLPASGTGLPPSLWQASRTQDVVQRLNRLPSTPLPALQALFYTLLLAEAEPPHDATGDARLLKARIEALRKYGAVDAGLALIERAGPKTPVLFDDWMELSLFKGTESIACNTLSGAPTLTDDLAYRIFCLVRTGDWPTAALTYDAGRATGLFEPVLDMALGAFLDPELAALPDTPPPARHMTPLLFRLFEANGTPLPTRNLPREYAVADLRGTLGWRAEVEAAERLARTGALPANRLLGLYTSRQPAASGGVWDRVRHVQIFDRAMLSGDANRIAAALPSVWQDMLENGLGVVFATLYGDRIAALPLPGLEDMTHQIGLLSPSYERLAVKQGLQTRSARFLASLAQGRPDSDLARTPVETSIARAFEAPNAATQYAALLNAEKLGEAIYQAGIDLDRAKSAQPSQIEAPLAALRLLGLEDVARRAALQILLLQSP